MKHPTTRQLYAYWDSLRGTRAAPERGEIEPGQIRHILADTFILELAPDGSAVFRLAGSRIGALFLRELKGSLFEGLWQPRDAGGTRDAVAAVAGEMAGAVFGLRAVGAARDPLDLELLLLPLRHRGRTHARALGCLSFAVCPAWIGLRPVTHVETVSLRILRPSGSSALTGGSDRHPPLAPERRFVVHQGGRA